MQRALRESNALRRDGPPLTLRIELIGDRPSGSLDPGLPLVQRTIAATRYFNVEPELAIGSTNANTPIALGIPAITIGHGGTGHGAHSLTEYWIDDEGFVAIQRALLLLVAEAGLAESDG